MIFKVVNSVDGDSDPLYFDAPSLEHAKDQFRSMLGDVPDSMLTWTLVSELPDEKQKEV